ncbi:MAG: ribose-5-phosphate isomerase RpiA [Acidimicrobiales bacterium]
MSHEAQKQLAAEHAAALVRDGMRVGLGTGSTVHYVLTALAKRRVRAHYVATSPATAHAAASVGLAIGDFEPDGRLDLAIDGADQVNGDGWLIKGAGAALTREKIVAASADRFVVIVDSSKLVERLGPPVPVEILRFGAPSTMRRLAPCRERDVAESPDGGLIVDHWGEVHEPADLARKLSSTPGVIEHGLFAPDLVSEVFVGVGESVRHIVVKGEHD